MNEKFNKNAKVEKFTTMLGIAVRLIVKDPLCFIIKFSISLFIFPFFECCVQLFFLYNKFENSCPILGWPYIAEVKILGKKDFVNKLHPIVKSL